MPVTAVAVQSLEMDCRSASRRAPEEQHKGITAITACKLASSGRSLNYPVQMLYVHACRAVFLLASQRHGGMTTLTGMLEWKDSGSVSMTSWSAWSFAWGWRES